MNEKLLAVKDMLNKKYKKNIVKQGTEITKFEMIPLKSPKLNWLTRGGIAESKVIEFFGAESGGKTTTALIAISEYQKKYPDRVVLYLDAENTLDTEWGALLGVNWENVILIKPENESAEMLLDMLMDAIRTGNVGLAVVDSIPFLIPKMVLDNTLEDKSYAGNSAVMTIFAEKVVPLCHTYNCTLIGINQVRDKIGSYVSAYNTPGGRAWKHACLQRFMFSKGAYIDENNVEQTGSCERPAGHIINVKAEKNKATKNDRRFGSYTLRYDMGVDVLNDTVDVAIMIGLVRQGGSWYYMVDYTTGEELKFQGKSKMLEHLRSNDEVFDALYSKVNEDILL